MKSRPEALLERRVLAALSRRFGPALVICKNEVGEGFYANVAGQLYKALASFGPDAVATARAILARSRVAYGLPVGSADLIGFYGPAGSGVSIELKSEDGRLRPEQEVWLRRMRELGVLAGVARSEDEAIAIVEGR